MRKILPLEERHIDAYTDIAFNAYPSFKDFSEEAVVSYKEVVRDILLNDPDVTFYGMFEKEKLIAVMRLFDFKMNLYGKIVPVCGIGFLGVHLMHKKEKAARAMVEFYEEKYRGLAVPISLLLPFRPDFYKPMGYGMGTKMNQYRIETAKIPICYEKGDIRYLDGKRDFDAILACHGRAVEKTHGMMMKFGDEMKDLKDDAFNRIIGSYGIDGQLEGYMVFQFRNAKPGNYTINNIYIKELIYENSGTLRRLLGFLRKQEDQVNLVIFNTEDENFYYLFDNPLNDSDNYIPFGYIESNTQAVGVMYKVLDVKKAFEQASHRDYNGVSLCAAFRITEPLSGKQETVTLDLQEGVCRIDDGAKPEILVEIGMSEFSALFMGCTSVRGLWELGLLRLKLPEEVRTALPELPEPTGKIMSADESRAVAEAAQKKEALLGRLDRAFYCSRKPVCYTDF